MSYQVIVPPGHPAYGQFFLFHIIWNVLPLALDRVLAGELAWREIPAFIIYWLGDGEAESLVDVDASTASLMPHA